MIDAMKNTNRLFYNREKKMGPALIRGDPEAGFRKQRALTDKEHLGFCPEPGEHLDAAAALHNFGGHRAHLCCMTVLGVGANGGLEPSVFWWQEKHTKERKCQCPGLGRRACFLLG